MNKAALDGHITSYTTMIENGHGMPMDPLFANVNHSCNPSCMTMQWEKEEDGSVIFGRLWFASQFFARLRPEVKPWI